MTEDLRIPVKDLKITKTARLQHNSMIYVLWFKYCVLGRSFFRAKPILGLAALNSKQFWCHWFIDTSLVCVFYHTSTCNSNY